ncbi:MAG TPA: YbaK/EbsC family protein [Anaerolineae bacterium]|jgi:prolyl-tRNA editing enzyme YbaK/EbsC (Cys-tRNA(Pro) deacylase)|nr:YbaK/EbsC family protein [Anaerolineae bacterium]
MDSTDLQQFLDDEAIRAEIVHLASSTPTVEAAAQAAGCRPEEIGKSILFLANGVPYLVIANGTTRVGYKALADYLAISRKRLKLANADQVVDITGYPVGTVPPFGHPERLPTIIEERVMNQEIIYVGGGAINALMRLSTAELLRSSQAKIVSLPHPSDPE